MENWHQLDAAAVLEQLVTDGSIGLTYRVSKKRLLFAWDSWAILAVYVFAVLVVYIMR